MRISKSLVDRTEPDHLGKRLIVWDEAVKGFGLLVLPSGIKTYFYDFRTREGRKRRFTIGKHGAITPDQARTAAEDLREKVRQGTDPLAEKTAVKAAPTLNDLLDAYLASARFASKAESTQAVDRGRIERHLRPLMGRRHLHLITRGEVERAFADIKEGKTAANVKTKARGRARVTGGEGTARMAIDLLRAIFAWGEQEEIAKANPVAKVKTGQSGVRETILEGASAYAELFKALTHLEIEQRIRKQVADAVRVIALTGARRGEIASLEWGHVDLEKARIVLPPASHKTGKTTGKPRIIGLPTAAQAIIAAQPRIHGVKFVFQPAKGSGAIALSKAWRKIRAAAGLPKELGLHGLRHSLASHMAMGGAEAAQIMTALGHRQLSTAQRYIHWAQDARQALAEKAAATALAGLEQSVGKKEGGYCSYFESESSAKEPSEGVVGNAHATTSCCLSNSDIDCLAELE